MSSNPRPSGFTLLELLCVLAVLSILVTLSAPLAGRFRSRAQGQQCVANLQGLGVHTQAYLTDHNNVWPQISQSGSGTPSPGQQAETTADRWIAALSPYGATDKVWRCPTIEGKIKTNGSPEALKNKRLDYVPTQFNEEPGAALQWPSHPWFIERTPNHGVGPYLLQAKGRVVSMEDLLKELR
jgi:prepilin-type N-terminal cleavage/methylation domain-containing protein